MTGWQEACGRTSALTRAAPLTSDRGTERRRGVECSANGWAIRACGSLGKADPNAFPDTYQATLHNAGNTLIMSTMKITCIAIWLPFCAAVQLASAEVAEVNGVERCKAPQESEVGCWAACLQTLLKLKGVDWSQNNILEAIKGSLNWSTASEKEITSFLRGFRSTTPGAPVSFALGQTNWRANCMFIRVADVKDLNFSMLADSLSIKRPIITCLKTSSSSMQHAVLVFKVEYDRVPLPPINGMIPNQMKAIRRMTYYDPLEDEIVTEDFQGIASRVAGFWIGWVDTPKDVKF